VALIVFNDYYNSKGICLPTFFFLSNNPSCKKFIEKQVITAINENDQYKGLTNNQILKLLIEKDEFQTQNPSIDSNIKIPNMWDFFSSNYNNFKNTINTVNNNYLAMVNLINSLSELLWRVIFKELKNMM